MHPPSRMAIGMGPERLDPGASKMEGTSYEKILVALDGSCLAEKEMPHAEALATKFGAELVG